LASTQSLLKTSSKQNLTSKSREVREFADPWFEGKTQKAPQKGAPGLLLPHGSRLPLPAGTCQRTGTPHRGVTEGLYRVEYQPPALPAFLAEANSDREAATAPRERAGRGGPEKGNHEDGERMLITTQPEQAALAELVASWRTHIEGQLTRQERAGQQLF